MYNVMIFLFLILIFCFEQLLISFMVSFFGNFVAKVCTADADVNLTLFWKEIRLHATLFLSYMQKKYFGIYLAIHKEIIYHYKYLTYIMISSYLVTYRKQYISLTPATKWLTPVLRSSWWKLK